MSDNDDPVTQTYEQFSQTKSETEFDNTDVDGSHNFSVKDFGTVTSCSACGLYIFAKRGLTCSVCRFNVHVKCRQLANGFSCSLTEPDSPNERKLPTIMRSTTGTHSTSTKTSSSAKKIADKPKPKLIIKVNGHEFQKVYFKYPTFCDHCFHFIWGVHKRQGYHCRFCKFNSHKNCYNHTIECPPRKDQLHPDHSHGHELNVRGSTCSNSSTNKINTAETAEGEGDFNDFYEYCDEVLGNGAYGVVKPCIEKATKHRYAVKIVNKRRFWMQPSLVNTLRRECDLLKQLKHQNIVNVNECFESKMQLQIVMELVNGGDLLDYTLLKKNGHLRELEAKYIFWQLLHALEFIHELKIAHRDIKPDNILLERSCTDDDLSEFPTCLVIPKFADFGFAKINNDTDRLNTQVGTPAFRAPEVMVNENKGYNVAVDMWSIGVVLYLVLKSKLPWDFDSGIPIEKQAVVFEGPEWEEVSLTAKDLILNLIVVDPVLRLTAHECLEHSWFHDADMRKHFPRQDIHDLLKETRTKIAEYMDPPAFAEKSNPASPSVNLRQTKTSDSMTTAGTPSPTLSGRNTLLAGRSLTDVSSNSSYNSNEFYIGSSYDPNTAGVNSPEKERVTNEYLDMEKVTADKEKGNNNNNNTSNSNSNSKTDIEYDNSLVFNDNNNNTTDIECNNSKNNNNHFNNNYNTDPHHNKKNNRKSLVVNNTNSILNSDFMSKNKNNNRNSISFEPKTESIATTSTNTKMTRKSSLRGKGGRSIISGPRKNRNTFGSANTTESGNQNNNISLQSDFVAHTLPSIEPSSSLPRRRSITSISHTDVSEHTRNTNESNSAKSSNNNNNNNNNNNSNNSNNNNSDIDPETGEYYNANTENAKKTEYYNAGKLKKTKNRRLSLDAAGPTSGVTPDLSKSDYYNAPEAERLEYHNVSQKDQASMEYYNAQQAKAGEYYNNKELHQPPRPDEDYEDYDDKLKQHQIKMNAQNNNNSNNNNNNSNNVNVNVNENDDYNAHNQAPTQAHIRTNNNSHNTTIDDNRLKNYNQSASVPGHSTQPNPVAVQVSITPAPKTIHSFHSDDNHVNNDIADDSESDPEMNCMSYESFAKSTYQQEGSSSYSTDKEKKKTSKKKKPKKVKDVKDSKDSKDKVSTKSGDSKASNVLRTAQSVIPSTKQIHSDQAFGDNLDFKKVDVKRAQSSDPHVTSTRKSDARLSGSKTGVVLPPQHKRRLATSRRWEWKS